MQCVTSTTDVDALLYYAIAMRRDAAMSEQNRTERRKAMDIHEEKQLPASDKHQSHFGTAKLSNMQRVSPCLHIVYSTRDVPVI